MLSTVAVQRLLEGAAASLHTHVEPHVEDRFALMQLRAIEELLRNLAGRVEWDAAQAVAEADAIEAVLGALGRAGWDGAPGAGPPAGGGDRAAGPAALARRREGLAALREGMTWLARRPDDDADARVAAARTAMTAFLRDGNDRERACLRSGMYA